MVSSIEAPLAFLQKPIETLFSDTIKTAHVTLGLVPEVLDTVDMMTASANECLRVINAAVPKLGNI